MAGSVSFFLSWSGANQENMVLLIVVTGMEKTRNLQKTIRRIFGSLDTRADCSEGVPSSTSRRLQTRSRLNSPLLSLYDHPLMNPTQDVAL